MQKNQLRSQLHYSAKINTAQTSTQKQQEEQGDTSSHWTVSDSEAKLKVSVQQNPHEEWGRITSKAIQVLVELNSLGWGLISSMAGNWGLLAAPRNHFRSSPSSSGQQWCAMSFSDWEPRTSSSDTGWGKCYASESPVVRLSPPT